MKLKPLALVALVVAFTLPGPARADSAADGPTFTKPISEAQAEIVHRIWAEERHRQDVLRRADKGAFATAVRAGATFVGSLLDPFLLVPVFLAGLVLRTPRKLSWALGGIVAAVTGLGAGLALQWNSDMAELGVLGMDRFYINPARLFDQLLGAFALGFTLFAIRRATRMAKSEETTNT